MAELVEQGVSGFHFAVGSSDSLRDRLESILREPEQLEQLYQGDLAVQSIDDDAETCEGLYRAATGRDA